MVTSKISFNDGSTRVINHSDLIIPGTGKNNDKPTLAQRLEGLVADLGQPRTINTVRGSETIFSGTYGRPKPRETNEIPTHVEGLDKRQLRNKHKHSPFNFLHFKSSMM